MKCTNKRIIHLSILVLLPNLLFGCGQTTLSMPYQLDSPVSSYQLNPVIFGAIDSFASELCVSATNISDGTQVDTSSVSAAGLFDLNNKDVLYAKNIHTQLPPASLTKVLTAIVALEHGNLEDIITVGEEVIITESGATLCGLEEGDKLTLAQALYAFLISSGNDVGNVIAKHIGGSLEHFNTMMNEEAWSLGATNSNFLNPHGLHDDDHYTTAYDMYLIFEKALENEVFRTIISTPEYTTVYHDEDGEEQTLKVKSTNGYLRETYTSADSITVMGGKTGTTSAAGSCLMLYSKDEKGDSYISIILGATDRDSVYMIMTELLSEI